ncbi:Kiwa anti-phage protein KwaB-like domain-containing protein, partial [Vibrio rumoiensis]
NKINSANTVLDYDFNTADLDDSLLKIPVNETDFDFMLKSIEADVEPKFIENEQELLGSWVYITRLVVKNKPSFYSVRKVSDSWSTKKVNGFANALFSNNVLVDIKDENVFRIDGKVDFFSYNEQVFIANKVNFESALNFRVGMEKNRDQVVLEFKKQDLFVDADEVKNLVGSNLKRLRKLSQVKNSGYYRDPLYLAQLKVVSENEGWDIKYNDDGKLHVSEQSIELVLKVLNNDRLKSMINQEGFDVDVKHKIG